MGRLTSAVSSVLGGLTNLVMIIVIGLFIAAEPNLYERGIAWMLPSGMRERFYRTSDRMGFTLRRLMAGRLLGMAVEGFGTWLLLMAGSADGGPARPAHRHPRLPAQYRRDHLGRADRPGRLSAGPETGLWAIAVYVIVGSSTAT